MRTTDRMKVYNRQFVARTATTDRVMRTTDREYVHTTVSLNKKHNERDDEMVQLTKMILKQTARNTRRCQELMPMLIFRAWSTYDLTQSS